MKKRDALAHARASRRDGGISALALAGGMERWIAKKVKWRGLGRPRDTTMQQL